MNPLEEEEELDWSIEKKILKLIIENDMKALRDMKIQLRELNYLEEFTKVELDNLISPLTLASHLGRVEVAKLLLENETIDVNMGTKDMEITPLIAACASGNYEIVKLLIENGADVNKPNVLSQPPLYFCFTRLQEDTNIFENNLICNKMANLLLQHGADVNFIVNKEKGKTLIMEYCSIKIDMSNREKETNLKIIRFLIENGANTALKSRKNKTAFDYASKHPHKDEVIEALKNTQQMYYFNTLRTTTQPGLPKVQKFKLFSTEEAVKESCCSIFKSCK
jgi:ankyrin repeat protein